jgi:hypothetical protein
MTSKPVTLADLDIASRLITKPDPTKRELRSALATVSRMQRVLEHFDGDLSNDVKLGLVRLRELAQAKLYGALDQLERATRS